MRPVALLTVMMLSAASAAGAQAAAAAGRPGAGPCPGFGEKPFNWDVVVSDPDTAARLKPSTQSLKHPKSMYRDGYRAAAVVSFVVDAKGDVVPGTSSIIEASDAEYRQWACDAVKRLRFEPAQKNGEPVASLAAIPYSFSASVGRRRR